MKAKELFNSSGELKHKLRTVSDLINHLATREEGDSNYSLLLGSGASVTSGIRTAGELIEVWKKDLYERLSQDSSCEDGKYEIDSFFDSKCASWFNPINPYSSLFEKRYDLPSQRRRFIEKEVDGRLPSIGYAYLTSIMDEGFINTVFTTNFDDLLNEAFYHFSNKRPIHCAHDSSVHSISITSKRPKIIKLHGDYLFDDIKSTLRETESLEQNIRDKMIELCKEYGLIVLGYSGSDRSVMDVLDFLVKQENYLKNGVYWCLRPDDEVNHLLLNLLWKDRVYPVLIDGFDEFFAEAHSELVSDYLDVENNIKQSKVRKTIEEIVTDKPNLSSNPVISKDIEAIKRINVRSDIGKFIDGPDSETSGLSIYDVRNLMEIDSYIKKGELKKATELCEEFKASSDDPRGKSSYIRKLIELSDRQGNSSAAVRWCSELIGIDRYDVGSNLLSARFKVNVRERYLYLKKMVEKIQYSPRLYREAARSGFKLIQSERGSKDVSLDDLMQLVDRSINVDPSLNNDAWSLKFDLISYQEKNGGSNIELSEFVDSLYNDNSWSINAHRMKCNYLVNNCRFEELKSVIGSLYEMYEFSSSARRCAIDDCLLGVVNKVIALDGDKDSIAILDRFFSKHSVENKGVEYQLARGNYELGYKKNVVKAEEICDEIRVKYDAEEFIHDVFDLNLSVEVAKNGSFDVGNINFDFYLDSLERIRHNLVEDYYYNSRYNILARKGAFFEAEKDLDKAYDCGLPLSSYIINKTYLFLRAGEYQKVLDFVFSYDKDIADFCDDDRYPVIINTEFAKKKVGQPMDKTSLMNIVAQSGKDSAKICALRILGRDNESRKLAQSKVEANALNFINYGSWPVMESGFMHEINPYVSR